MAHKKIQPKDKPNSCKCGCGEMLTNKQGHFFDDRCHKRWFKKESDNKIATNGGKGTMVKVNDKTWVMVSPGRNPTEAVSKVKNNLENSFQKLAPNQNLVSKHFINT